MSYMVLYTRLDSSAAFERCEELAAAVAEVERLRNEQSIDGAQIYRLEEVKFEIKPYFRVELPEVSAVASSAPSIASSATSTVADAAPADEDAPWTTASEPSMMIAPPPPPPPAPVAPMAYDDAPTVQGEDAISGGRRGLFGR
ncbi:MAG TPA: hypothetical protein VM282_25865 [Acidimicrobiales bacterium]|nr:hypothetical protein [Acidimicrobiales bacterium]